MRSAYLFPAIAAVGLASVASIGHAVGAQVLAAVAGYVAGVAFTIAASIVVNSCNAARYGRQVWDESVHSDFIDEPAVSGPRRRVRRGVQDRGLHAEGIVR